MVSSPQSRYLKEYWALDWDDEAKCSIDSLTVDAGAVVDIQSSKTLVARKFFGSGEITSSKKAALQTFSNASITSDFSGKLTGNLRLTSCSVVLLRGTESSNTGDKSVLCTTRPIVLKGDGRILHNVETRFAFKGITSGGDNPKTLMLDGSGSGENIISGLDDSEGGAIFVRKKGSGRWILSANSSIRGDIDVQAGTLCVMAPPSSYEWFRFTDMQVCTNRVGYEPTAPSSTFFMREMAFFDEDGISQLVGLQCVEDWRNVQSGQFAYAKDPVKGSVSNWNKLFDDAGNSYASPDVGTAPNREDESSWFSLVFRMPENSNPVKTFDLVWNTSSSGAGALNHPADFKMEGSVDGLHWVEIFSTNNVVSPGSGKWLYDKGNYPSNSLNAAIEDPTKRRHGFSFALPAFDNDIMDQVGIVSVAAAGRTSGTSGVEPLEMCNF